MSIALRRPHVVWLISAGLSSLLAALFITAFLGWWRVACVVSSPAGTMIDFVPAGWDSVPGLTLRLLPAAVLTVLCWPFLARRVPRIEETRFSVSAATLGVLVGFDAVLSIVGMGWCADSFGVPEPFSWFACSRPYVAGVIALGALLAAPRMLFSGLGPGAFTPTRP